MSSFFYSIGLQLALDMISDPIGFWAEFYIDNQNLHPLPPSKRYSIFLSTPLTPPSLGGILTPGAGVAFKPYQPKDESFWQVTIHLDGSFVWPMLMLPQLFNTSLTGTNLPFIASAGFNIAKGVGERIRIWSGFTESLFYFQMDSLGLNARRFVGFFNLGMEYLIKAQRYLNIYSGLGISNDFQSPLVVIPYLKAMITSPLLDKGLTIYPEGTLGVHLTWVLNIKF